VPFGTTWIAEADDLVRSLPPAKAAKLNGRSLGSVYQRRQEFEISSKRGTGHPVVNSG
jgi:hypothetical protein